MSIEFDYMVPHKTLEAQANEQGFTLGWEAENLDIVRRCMVVCWVNGLCTDKQYEAMVKKIDRKIKKALKPLE